MKINLLIALSVSFVLHCLVEPSFQAPKRQTNLPVNANQNENKNKNKNNNNVNLNLKNMLQQLQDFTGLGSNPTDQVCINVCGNGKLDEGEECDDGDKVNTNECTNDCKKATCGDGIHQIGVEECDDANDNDSDSCSCSCKVNVCGNAKLDEGEECDDGDGVNTNACTNDCKIAICGDGIRQEGFEECDDGNDVDDDSCSLTCTVNMCGNGRLDVGEECDDGDGVNTNACTNDCKNAICGDRILHEGAEECDDGNEIDGDACTTECKVNAGCAVVKSLYDSFCNENGGRIPRRRALWPLTGEYGAQEIMQNYTHYKGSNVVPVTGPTGKVDTAHIWPNNANDYIRTNLAGDLNYLENSSFSFTFYAKTTNSDGTNPLLEFEWPNDYKLNMWYREGNNKIHVQPWCDADCSFRVNCPTTWNGWHYIAVVVDQTNSPSTVTAYCENQSVTEAKNLIRVEGELLFGKRTYVQVDELDGFMSCIALHDKALTKEEIDRERELCHFFFYNDCECPTNSTQLF